MTGDALLRALASLLPRQARARYLEEWRADSAAAAEAGLGRRDVVRGAAMLTVTIDRDLPAHTGEPRGAVPNRWARRGLALFVAAVVVLVGSYLTGADAVTEAGASHPGLVSAFAAATRLSSLFVLGAVLVGVLLVAAAAAATRAPLARIAFGAAMTGPLVIAATIAFSLPSLVLVPGFVLAIFGGVLTLVVVTGPSPLSLQPRVSSRRQRVPVALAGLAVTVTVLVLGAVDLIVWNPLAKVPGEGLDAIYGRMVADDGFRPALSFGSVVVWAAFWTIAAVVPVVVAMHRGQTWLTPRRLLMLQLTILGVALFFRLFAGFGIGISIADTWGTSGTGASVTAAILPFVGQAALAVAVILNGWAPRVRPAAVAATA